MNKKIFFLLWVILLFCMCTLLILNVPPGTARAQEDPQPAVTVSAYYVLNAGEKSFTVKFKPAVYDPFNGTVRFTYDWYFGDGGASTEKEPRHTFKSRKAYTVTCRVTFWKKPKVIVQDSIEIDVSGAVWPAVVHGASDNYYFHHITSDGSGSAIITWNENRSGLGYDIYAQRLDSAGKVQWTTNALAICKAQYGQMYPRITSDGEDGAIITWMDSRILTNEDIYARRVDSGGNLKWTEDGVPICTAANNQTGLQITSDGGSGAIITWMDYRSGSHHDIYARRVDSNGNPLWAGDSVPICTAANNQISPQIVSDGSGGAIITWIDNRSGSHHDIYARRVDSNGNPLWTDNGVPICTAPNNQEDPQIVSDGDGGAIITWSDYRSGSYCDIYARRIDKDGNSHSLWPDSDAAICTAPCNQVGLQIVSDGSGGAIITWMDCRISGQWDIYAQRIDSTAKVLWNVNGVPICTASNSQGQPQLISDGSGGAIITWMDSRRGNENPDIYAQYVDAVGNLRIPGDGLVICEGVFPLNDSLQIVSDGSGGAFIAMEKIGSPGHDLYVQRVYKIGVSVQQSVVSIAANPTSGDALLVVKFTSALSGVSGSAGITYNWNFGDGTTSAEANPSHTYINVGTYSVTCTVTGSGTPALLLRDTLDINVIKSNWPAAVCTADKDQLNPRITSDGSGGAVITWRDNRSGNWDIYAQRLNIIGKLPWTANGLAICTAVNQQVETQITSDGSGSAIITWKDNRSQNGDIYAQRVDITGKLLWTANGTAIAIFTASSTASRNQRFLQISPDGSGGAVITWQAMQRDNYSGIYAHGVDNTGKLWRTGGVVGICTAAYSKDTPRITPDDSGGAIITWKDYRSVSHTDIYAQRVDNIGKLLWNTAGVGICMAAYSQDTPRITSDGSGGAIITRRDYRKGNNYDYDIYAQRIDSAGKLLWTADGVAICTTAYHQNSPRITSDGSGGAIITWQDSRSENIDIYAQRIDSTGQPLWTANGVALCTATYSQLFPQLTSDGSGGAIITWQDDRSGNTDIYAQRIDGTGKPLWTVNGAAVCTAAYNQNSPQLTSDGSGGAIITWADVRSGNWDIYAQRITKDGQIK